MALGKHIGQAVERLEEASARIGEARERPLSLEGLRDWLAAVTDYCTAASDVQRYANESVHEKLHAIASHARIPDVL